LVLKRQQNAKSSRLLLDLPQAPEYHQGVKDDLQEKGLKLEFKGRFEEAAQLFLQAGRHEKAAFLYQKAGNPTLAMRACAEGGVWGKAAEIAFKIGDHAQAGAYYEKAENWVKASEAYERAGRFKQAGEILEKYGNPENAAEYFLKTGEYLRAGSLWEKAGSVDQAVRAYRQYLADSAGTLGQLSGPDARRIGQLFVKVGDYVRAAEIFLKTTEPLKALFLLMEAGEIARATQLYREKFMGQGFDILNQITRGEIVPVFGTVCMAAGEYPEAAQCFEKAGDLLKAATAYRSSGDLFQAAELFLKAGRLEDAAGLYESAGHCSAAADLYYKLKAFDRAAACFEKEGDYYKAGRLYQYRGQNTKAIQLLQKIPADSKEFLRASILICKAFMAEGLMEMARKRYQDVCREYPVTEETLEIYYDFAELLNSIGDAPGAKGIYEKIVGVDMTYKDVAQKLKKLTGGIPRQAVPEPQTPPPAFPTPAPAPEIEAPPPVSAPSEATQKPAPAADQRPSSAVDPEKMNRASRAIPILRKFPFFQNLTEGEIVELWPAILRREISKDELLIQSGAYAPGFFLLIQGAVTLLTPMGRPIATLSEPGALFGVAAYFSGETSSVGVRAAEVSKIVQLSGRELSELLRADPALSEKLRPLFAASLEKEMASIPRRTPYHLQILEAKKRLS